MSDLLKKWGILKDDSPKEEIVNKEVISFPYAGPDKKRGTFIDVEELNKNSEKVFVESVRQSIQVDDNPYLSQLENIYNEGFKKLNKPEIDFFELYQMLLKSGDLSSLEALKMAYNMCSSMNPNLTYKMLDEQANQYAKELMNSYEKVKQNGLSKLKTIKQDYNKEKETIDVTISRLEQDLDNWKRERENIDDKYNPTLEEIKLKKEANEVAYSNLMDKINKVQMNIKNNL